MRVRIEPARAHAVDPEVLPIQSSVKNSRGCDFIGMSFPSIMGAVANTLPRAAQMFSEAFMALI
jgi:hypothetical protein